MVVIIEKNIENVKKIFNVCLAHTELCSTELKLVAV